MGRTRVHTGYHRILVAIFTAFVGVAGLGLVGTAAAATGPNRGGVVVDLANGTVKTVPITFGGDVFRAIQSELGYIDHRISVDLHGK